MPPNNVCLFALIPLRFCSALRKRGVIVGGGGTRLRREEAEATKKQNDTQMEAVEREYNEAVKRFLTEVRDRFGGYLTKDDTEAVKKRALFVYLFYALFYVLL